MPAPYRHVTLSDRRIIFNMINEQCPIKEIGERTGFRRSTIYREIGRNKVKPNRENRPFPYYGHHRTEGNFPVSARLSNDKGNANSSANQSYCGISPVSSRHLGHHSKLPGV